MALPFFYKKDIDLNLNDVVLDEKVSKHIVQVLRMKNGEHIQLTNGKGKLFTAVIAEDNRKKCRVEIKQVSEVAHPKSKITIAISPIKNNARFEWFLEKATEIGVSEIIPLICERTEKQHFKWERMNSILVSAMLQSQQCLLPKLHEPIKYIEYVKYKKEDGALQKYIAHCGEENNKLLLRPNISTTQDQLILIGPEGDFTINEIIHALENNFTTVSLGDTRLRTETAGLVAAVLLSIGGNI